MTININPNILNNVSLSPMTAKGYLNSYKNMELCGYAPIEFISSGKGEITKYIEANGGIEIGPLTLNIVDWLTYREIHVKGPLEIPLCISGRGIIDVYKTYKNSECFQWEFPDSIKSKIMSILSLKPEYTTEDLRELLNVHRITLPELGEGIDYEVPDVMEGINNQDRIKFHILRSKVVGYISERMVRNWLVGVVEYNSQPCALFMNAYWDTFSPYPLRYILNVGVFREMVIYIKSILFPNVNCGTGDIYNTAQDSNTMRFRLRSESYTLVLEQPLTQEALVEMDKNVSKFLALYTSYKNI